VLREAGLQRAKLAVAALKIEDANRLLVYRCRELGVPVAVQAFDRSVLPEFRAAEPRFIIDSKAAADRRLEALLSEAGGAAG